MKTEKILARSKYLKQDQMASKKILFICGSLNQTTMMYQIGQYLSDYDCYFTPYYCDGLLKWLTEKGWLDFTPLGGITRQHTVDFLLQKKVRLDFGGIRNNYDLVVTCSDLVIQKNIRHKRVILVQEGMTDPENLMYYLVKSLKLPRYLASTSTYGLSHAYDKFCVASEGYRELFIRKGVRPDKIVVTGIPNYDDLDQCRHNSFPHRGYVLAATSDARETLKFDNRKRFLKNCVTIANGRPLIFKLHPNENFSRATREINRYAPGSLIFTNGNTNEMVANCDELITQYSTVVYTGIALGKKVHSYFDVGMLTRLAPLQNGGTSAAAIAKICRQYLHKELPVNSQILHPSYKTTVKKVFSRVTASLSL